MENRPFEVRKYFFALGYSSSKAVKDHRTPKRFIRQAEPVACVDPTHIAKYSLRALTSVLRRT